MATGDSVGAWGNYDNNTSHNNNRPHSQKQALTLQMNKPTLSSDEVLHIEDLYDDSTALSFPFTPLTPLSPAAYDYNHLTTAGSLTTDTSTLLQSEGPVVKSESTVMSAGLSSCTLGRLERNSTLVSYWSADDLVGMDMGLEGAATATQTAADSDAERSTNLTVSKAKYLLDNSILLPDEASILNISENKPSIKPTNRSSKNRLSKEEPPSATKRPRLVTELPHFAATAAPTTAIALSTTASVPAETQQQQAMSVGKKRRNSAHSVKYAVTFDKGVDDVEQAKLKHKFKDNNSSNDTPSATSSLDGQPVAKAKRVLGRPRRSKASQNSDPSDLASSDRPLVLRLSQSSSEFVSDYEYDDDEADVKSDSNHADKLTTGSHSWGYPSSRSFFHQATGGVQGNTGYSSGNDDLGSAYFSSGLMTMGSLQNQTLYNHTVRDEVVLDVPEDSRIMVNMRSSASTCSSLQGNETPGARSRAESVSQAEHIDTIHLPTGTLLTSPSHSRQTYLNLDDMTAYSLLSLKYGSSDVTRKGGNLSSASSVAAATDFTASPSNRAPHIIPTGSDSNSGRSSGSEVADVVPLPLTLPNRS